MSNLYEELTRRPRHHMMIPLPIKNDDGSTIELPMVVLSGRELYEVKQKAEADAKAAFGKNYPKKDEASNYDEIYADMLGCWTIYYAVRLPSDLNKKFFPTKEAVMDVFTADQAGIMYNHYMTVQQNQPWLLHLDGDDPEKLEELVQKIITDAQDPHFFLNSLTSQSANVLIHFMAAKLQKLQTDSGSPTTPLDSMEENV